MGDWGLAGEWTLEDDAERSFTWTVGNAVVRGRVVTGEGGRPAGRAILMITGPAFDFRAAEKDGSFRLEGLPPGTYRVTARQFDLVSRHVVVEVPATGSPAPIVLALVPGGRLLLRFEDGRRAAFEGADLRLTDADGEEYLLDPSADERWDRVTGTLSPGKYRLHVEVAGRPARRFGVEIEEGRDVELILETP